MLIATEPSMETPFFAHGKWSGPGNPFLCDFVAL